MNQEIDEYKDKMARRNKILAQARAILQRAKRAGIPDRFMRIGDKEFSSLLAKNYYDVENRQNVMSIAYENPDELLDRSFILIDGGTHLYRRKAGFALLFRMIACDRFGYYESCRTVSHSLQVRHDFNRKSFVSNLKEHDVLFLGECEANLFSDRDDVGTFFDEILEYREDNKLPTIISFVDPLGNLNVMKSRVYGNYLSELTRDDKVVDDGRKFHIRVEG